MKAKNFYIKEVIIGNRSKDKNIYTINFIPAVIESTNYAIEFCRNEIKEYSKKFKRYIIVKDDTYKFIINGRSKYPIDLYVSKIKVGDSISYKKTIHLHNKNLEDIVDSVNIKTSSNELINIKQFMSLVNLTFKRVGCKSRLPVSEMKACYILQYIYYM